MFIFITIFLSTQLFYISRPSLEDIRRLLPRVQRECRRWLAFWDRILLRAQSEPKFLFQLDKTHIFIISLVRTPERKQTTLTSLEVQQIQYTVHDAVDGLKDLDKQSLSIYAGIKKRRRLSISKSWSYERLLAFLADYEAHNLRDPTTRIALHERLRFGCFMSHIELWQRIGRMKLRFAVILEDDVILVENFIEKLELLLQELPQSWDLLYLNGSFKKFGPRFSSHLALSRGGVGAFGYVISERAIPKLLSASTKSNKAIDHVMDEEVLSGRVLSFHAFEPLVLLQKEVRSTLAY